MRPEAPEEVATQGERIDQSMIVEETSAQLMDHDDDVATGEDSDGDDDDGDGDDEAEDSDEEEEEEEDDEFESEEQLPQPFASRQSLFEDPLRRRRSATRKRKQRDYRSSSASDREMLDFPVSVDVGPDAENPAGHISVRELPQSLTHGRLAGPGKGWLGLPVGLYTKDPFDFPADKPLEQRLPYYRVAFINFTANIAIRWNVGAVNLHGETPKTIAEPRPSAPSCATSHVRILFGFNKN